MDLSDVILLLHPMFAVIVVFPLLGIVVNRAVLVRQRRLTGSKKIPSVVGSEHVQLGRWLAGSVVGLVLLALINDVVGNIIEQHLWTQSPAQVAFIGMIVIVVAASLVLLYRAKSRLWRGTFATLSSMSLILLGAQDGVYRKTDQWYVSHYYYGITASVLMIVSVAILREIYQDSTHRWRNVHIVLNSVALLLFIGQGITGTQALLEVPLHWQKPYVEQLYKQHCRQKDCTIEAPSVPQRSP